MGNKPYKAPCNTDINARLAGIPYTMIANNTASNTVSKLARYPFIFRIKDQNMKITGIAATSADSPRF
jgi:hypothetical protein